ncbi:MAG TPA: hypothetical protein VHE35_22715 [Kofleriaceae bacterium]|nr:hypothetical protein [Kofleriaceae bacterium]
MMRSQFLAILAAAALAACGGKSKGDTTTPMGGSSKVDGAGAAPDASTAADPAQVKADLFAAETAAYQQAKPVFDQSCGSCHSQGGKQASAKKLAHLDITTYPFAGEHKDTITVVIRHVLGIDGAKPIMPDDKPGSVKGDELALIAAWADAYDAAEAGGAHADKPAYGEPDSSELPDDDD